MAPQEKDELYLHNWGQGGTDPNAAIYFAKHIKDPLTRHIREYIASKNADELEPENHRQVWLDLWEGADGQPGIKTLLEQSHPVRVESLRVFFESVTTPPKAQPQTPEST